MSRKWSEISQHEKDDPTWGLEGCAECGEFEGDYFGLNERTLCERCCKAENRRIKELLTKISTGILFDLSADGFISANFSARARGMQADKLITEISQVVKK